MALNPQDLVEGSAQVATLPTIFNEINDAVEDPESSFTEIARIISADSALSGRLLKIVNSSFFGFSSPIETITHAITIVGTAQLRDLVLATTVINQFQGLPRELIDMESFWYHSIACGLAARVIAVYRRENNPERFYVKGLLHDLGRLLLYMNVPDQVVQVFGEYEKNGKMLYESERSILGFDHADVGGVLLKNWKLPVPVEEAVGHHHSPLQAPHYPREAAIVHLADIIAHAMELGKSGEHYVPPLDAKAWDQIGLPASLLGSIVEQVDRQAVETAQMFIVDD